MNQIDLLKLNVNDHVEKKNGLSYLSWAWAWAEALKADPNANFSVEGYMGPDDVTRPYMDINGTALVFVGVTMFGKKVTCFLPVMDYRNKPIPKPTAFDVNTTIMRCLVKGIAMHGLGLYIYAGEDLPESFEEKGEEVRVSSVEIQITPDKIETVLIGAPATMVFVNGVEVNAENVSFEIAKKAKSLMNLNELKKLWKEREAEIEALKNGAPKFHDTVKAIFAEMKTKLKD